MFGGGGGWGIGGGQVTSGLGVGRDPGVGTARWGVATLRGHALRVNTHDHENTDVAYDLDEIVRTQFG